MNQITNQRPVVIKIGGAVIADGESLDRIAADISGWKRPVVIVQGAGPQIDKKIGVGKRAEGVRITSPEDLEHISEAYEEGFETISRAFARHGVSTENKKGNDGLLLAIRFSGSRMGEAGYMNKVKLENMPKGEHKVIVVSPLARGGNTTLNVNADHAAKAIAEEMAASALIFMTAKGAVLDKEGSPITKIGRSMGNKIIKGSEIVWEIGRAHV